MASTIVDTNILVYRSDPRDLRKQRLATEDLIQAALHATVFHQLPWYDALMWAYADVNGLTEILSEDFQHGRLYGHVRVRNPFL